ncbi:hypothetical protein TKK_0009698 [Trichogramma kaykai]|uniref:Uncharacterized protein n=1 Tax=Trichogramma kaykai TaxID=54128 RepID=A0ABD2X0Q6_9HYME
MRKTSAFLFLIFFHEVACQPDITTILRAGLDLISAASNPVDFALETFNFVQVLLGNGEQEDSGQISEKLDAISDQLNQISEEISDFKDELYEKLDLIVKNVELKNKLDSVFSIMNEINSYFLTSIEIQKPKRVLNSTLDDFLRIATTMSPHGLKYLLSELHVLLSQGKWSDSIMKILTDPQLEAGFVCERRQSHNQIIYNLYKMIYMSEFKGITTMLFAYHHLSKKERRKGEIPELAILRKEYNRRSTNTLIATKKAMSRVSRDYWRCEPGEQIEAKTYVPFSPFLQKFVMFEQAAEYGSCQGGCDRYDHILMAIGCSIGYDPSCGLHSLKKCTGFVRNCETFHNYLTVCNTKSSDGQYRYKSIKDSNGEVYGIDDQCDGDLMTWAESRRSSNLIYQCENCLCTCEDLRVELNNYIDLQGSTSDISQNKVVTGVAFRMLSGVLHIAIQQGKLHENGTIERSEVKWKRVNDYIAEGRNVKQGEDYVQLNWDRRTFALNEPIDVPDSHAVTGVRFQLDRGMLRLAVRLTEFEFETGNLLQRTSFWIKGSQPKKEMEEIVLKNPGIPTNYQPHLPYTDQNQFIVLRPSDMKKDVGQTVVPFVDALPVMPHFPVPLEKVSLYYKGMAGSGGYLSLKLTTFAYETTM